MLIKYALEAPLSTLTTESRSIGIGIATYGHFLQTCINTKSPVEWKGVHGHIIKSGFDSQVFLCNRLIDLYAKCACLADANRVFESMPLRDAFTWNTIITGYAKCGRMEDARRVFDKMSEPTSITWNAMIAGYTHNGHCEEALKQYRQMRQAGMKPNRFTFASVLSVCTRLSALEMSKQFHAQIAKNGSESNAFVGSALVDMYAKCGSIEDARLVFDKMSERDTVTWTAMIAGYAQYRYGLEALNLFRQMQLAGVSPNEVTYAGIVSACAGVAALEQGNQVHAHMIKIGYDSNLFVSSALVDMYAKCESIHDAQQLFDKMRERDVVLWNALIVGYAQNGYSEEGLKLFGEMQKVGIKPDEVTFTGILNSWASLAALKGGRQVHCLVVRAGFESNVCVGSSLVDMYVKCGSIEEACQVFGTMPERNIISWNAMIGGYALNGYGRKALQLFEKMVSEAIKPNDSTFISVLSACNYAGLMDEGCHYFNSMGKYYDVMPRLEHYACLIDLLARAGQLDEATHIIDNMPFEPNAIVWGALLGACRTHGNIKLGERAAKALLELEPQYAAPYVLLSNMYAAAGRWDDAAKVRKTMKEKGVKKMPGCSWIDVKDRVHAFVAEEVTSTG